MRQHGKQEPGSSYQQSPLNAQSAVFPGKPYQQGGQNLAVQRSLMEIFDEFTEVISGELKSMSLSEAESELGETRRNPPMEI
ncbi:MAG TPA: hypothetical protein V6C52_12705 [Coleofasciculaceae cyanobacterium]|jgi:hypothetical protein